MKLLRRIDYALDRYILPAFLAFCTVYLVFEVVTAFANGAFAEVTH